MSFYKAFKDAILDPERQLQTAYIYGPPTSIRGRLANRVRRLFGFEERLELHAELPAKIKAGLVDGAPDDSVTFRWNTYGEFELPEPCLSITGVYGTLHTTAGDITTGPPTAVRIDCEFTHFTFWIPVTPFSGVLDSFTIHLGVHSKRMPVDREPFPAGNSLTISQTLMWTGIEGIDVPPPEWSNP